MIIHCYLWDRYPFLGTIITSNKRGALAIESHVAPLSGNKFNLLSIISLNIVNILIVLISFNFMFILFTIFILNRFVFILFDFILIF